MLHQVVSSVFDLTEEYFPVWKGVSGSESVPTFGFAYSVGLEPINVNLGRMIDKFRLGANELSRLYEVFLPGDLLKFIKTIVGLPVEKFAVPDDVWVEIIYNTALACHRKLMSREHIIKSLTPLYLGKVASFVIETKESDADQVEQRLEELCSVYEKRKPALIEKW